MLLFLARALFAAPDAGTGVLGGFLVLAAIFAERVRRLGHTRNDHLQAAVGLWLLFGRVLHAVQVHRQSLLGYVHGLSFAIHAI